jgi:hypothetical protein
MTGAGPGLRVANRPELRASQLGQTHTLTSMLAQGATLREGSDPPPDRV